MSFVQNLIFRSVAFFDSFFCLLDLLAYRKKNAKSFPDQNVDNNRIVSRFDFFVLFFRFGQSARRQYLCPAKV